MFKYQARFIRRYEGEDEEDGELASMHDQSRGASHALRDAPHDSLRPLAPAQRRPSAAARSGNDQRGSRVSAPAAALHPHKIPFTARAERPSSMASTDTVEATDVQGVKSARQVDSAPARAITQTSSTATSLTASGDNSGANSRLSSSPIYKQPWFFTVVGLMLVSGVLLGLWYMRRNAAGQTVDQGVSGAVGVAQSQGQRQFDSILPAAFIPGTAATPRVINTAAPLHVGGRGPLVLQ